MTANTWTKASINTKQFDTSNNFDATNFRFTAPINGYYQINGQVAITPAGASTNVGMRAAVYKNGAALIYSSTQPGNGSNTSVLNASMSRLLYLVTGDYIELYGYCGEGGRTINGDTNGVFTFLTGHLVSTA